MQSSISRDEEILISMKKNILVKIKQQIDVQTEHFSKTGEKLVFLILGSVLGLIFKKSEYNISILLAGAVLLAMSYLICDIVKSYCITKKLREKHELKKNDYFNNVDFVTPLGQELKRNEQYFNYLSDLNFKCQGIQIIILVVAIFLLVLSFYKGVL